MLLEPGRYVLDANGETKEMLALYTVFADGRKELFVLLGAMDSPEAHERAQIIQEWAWSDELIEWTEAAMAPITDQAASSTISLDYLQRHRLVRFRRDIAEHHWNKRRRRRHNLGGYIGVSVDSVIDIAKCRGLDWTAEEAQRYLVDHAQALRARLLDGVAAEIGATGTLDEPAPVDAEASVAQPRVDARRYG